MDDTDEFGYLYDDLDDHVNAGLTTVNSSSDSTVKELESNDCEFNNRLESSVEEANAALDLGDGIQSEDYSSESEDDLCIVLNEIERVDSRQLEIEGKEEDFRIGNGLGQHEKCEPVGYGKGDWSHFRFPYFGGLTDVVENGFNFFLPRNWTIFDVNIEELDYKPWRKGANISDYFNFDLDEDSWKSYCLDLDLLRDKAVMSNWVRHDQPAFTVKEINKEPEKLKGRAIPVRSSFGERIPSTDIWRPPPERDSDVVIHVNMTCSMEDKNDVDTIGVRIPEEQGRELESSLMENDIEPPERYFDLEPDDSYCSQDTDPMSYSYNEKEEIKSRTATLDFGSYSEESVKECNLNRVHLSLEQKAEFQSSRHSSSTFGANKMLKPRKGRNDKKKNLIEDCHDIYTSDSDRYRGSWGAKKHRKNSRSSPIKEQRDQLFVRQVGEPGPCWNEMEDRPPIGIRRYRFMDVQNPRNPRSHITSRYGRSTGNAKYNIGAYTGHLQMERHYINQTTHCRENILSQRGHYRQNLVGDYLHIEDEVALGTLKEWCDERRYNRPVNRRFNNFHKGFVKKGYCYDGFSRNVATNKPFMNGRRWYTIDWLDKGNSRMCTFIDIGERNYIADDYEGSGHDLLPLRHKEVVNRFVDVRKKLWRKDYKISGEECSQCNKRSTHCSSDGQDQNHKISRFEESISYRAGLTNTISRVHRYDDNEEILRTDKIGEREVSQRILEAMDKIQKRGERFQESAFMKKGGEENEKMTLREGATGLVADECKPMRPVRRRKWGCH